MTPEFHQGDPVNRYEHRRVAPCCSIMAREFLDTFGEPRAREAYNERAALAATRAEPGASEGLREALDETVWLYLQTLGVERQLFDKMLDGWTARLSAYHGLTVSPPPPSETGS